MTRTRRPDPREDLLAFLDYEMDRMADQPVDPRKYSRRKTNNPKAGGWKGSPNSLAALDAHRMKGALGHRPKQMMCRVCGTQPRVQGLEVCRHHGGAQKVMERKRAAGLPLRYKVNAAHTRVITAMNAGAIPLELLRTEMFQAAWRAKMIDWEALKGRKDSRDLYLRRAAIMLLWEMTRAWVLMTEHGDNTAWEECVRKARDLKLI